MYELPLSRHEEGRIAALRLYDILDTLPEQEFDNIAQLAAEVCKAPIALISLIDDNIQWFKSRVGIDLNEMPRELSFCRYTILDDDLFEVTDPASDSRFDRNPFVTGPLQVSFYAGVPLINKDGYRLGTLSVLSTAPNKLDRAQKTALKTLAQSVMNLLELRRSRKERNSKPVPENGIVSDITGELLHSELLHEIETLSKTGSWDYIANTGVTTWSKGMFEILEIDEKNEQKTDFSLINYVSYADLEKVKAVFDRHTTDEQEVSEIAYKKITKKGKDTLPVKVEKTHPRAEPLQLSEKLAFKIITGKGREKEVCLTIKKRTNGKGKVTGMFGVLQEVEEKKPAYIKPGAEIKQGNLYYNAPFGYHVIDSQGYFTEINDTELGWLGYTKEEVINKKAFRDILSDSSIKAFEDNLPALIKNGYVKELVLELRKKDSNPLYVLSNFTAAYNDDGSLLNARVISFDITKLKKQQEAIEESEAMYRNLIEESAQMLFTADTQGRFTYVSNRLKKTIGYSNRDLLGKLFASIYDGEWRKKAIAFYNKQLLDKIEETTFLFPIIIRTGEKLWIEQVATLIKKNNNIVGYRFALYDITERLKTQEAMQEAARLAMEAKDMQQTFLGKMSHEIRTPMNGVVGMVNLLNTTQLTAEQQEFVDGIKESSVNMIRIINDILDVTKIQSGKLIFEETDFVLKNLVNSVIFSLKAAADQKNIQLISRIDSQIPDALVADPVRLNQVLLNLAGNALKFTDKGSISISVQIKESHADRMTLEFIVADTGIGIPQNKINTIFESFTQAQSDTTRKYGGTGLGLTIAKQLIEQQGGEIKVTSKEGKGSVFTFTFNFKLNNHPDVNEKTQSVNLQISSLAGYHILLVEDNVMNQRVAKYTIEKWGAQMTIADSGAKAIELLTKNTFDLILMDIQMPDMNGIQTTTKIRKELKINTPIMAMTASVMQGERENCMKAGMNDYISKPFNPAELNQRMLELLPAKDRKPVVKKITNINYLKNAVGGEISAVKEILEIYLSKTPPLLDAMEKDIAANNLTGVQGLVHNLKNSVGIIGADHLFHLLNTIESNLVNKESIPETMRMLEEMKQIARQSLKEIIEEYKLL